MSSRDYIKHVVSANTSLNGQRLGDEVYNPITNQLFKTVPVNGTQVTNSEVLLNNAALANNSISVGNLTIGPTRFNKNGTITNYGITANDLGLVGDGSGTTIDLTLGNYVIANTGFTTNWTFSNPVPPPNACGFILELKNGGSKTQNWPATGRWPGGIAPALTSSGTDILVFITDDGGVNWRGVASMLDSK